MEAPSERYASAILKGPSKGKTLLPVWEQALRQYYRNMGWDEKTGKPLPETLKRFGLDYVIKDIW
jgi:aldehyde:ferredoxin oxidoreductase